MKRRAIFTSTGLVNEIKLKANGNQKNTFIEDMVTGEYYRCYGVAFDEDGNLILRVKSLNALSNGINDLYMDNNGGE